MSRSIRKINRYNVNLTWYACSEIFRCLCYKLFITKKEEKKYTGMNGTNSCKRKKKKKNDYSVYDFMVNELKCAGSVLQKDSPQSSEEFHI